MRRSLCRLPLPPTDQTPLLPRPVTQQPQLLQRDEDEDRIGAQTDPRWRPASEKELGAFGRKGFAQGGDDARRGGRGCHDSCFDLRTFEQREPRRKRRGGSVTALGDGRTSRTTVLNSPHRQGCRWS